ncbi:MAG: glycosyltransferase, partial [Pseudolabrys sp.]|nr:glycosyltransferase [Pseudolabrys sp.]
LLRPGLSEVLALIRVAVGGGARPDQGLLIARPFYDALGGHPGDADAEAAMLRRIGRRRLAMLAASARPAG